MGRTVKTPKETTATVRIDRRMLKRLDGLARKRSRSRTSVLMEAVERYLEYEEWFASEVRKGLREAERGELVDHEVVVKEWEAKLAAKVDSRR
jgi:RHH-type transcriptional regulator, rel operon repressor / antitoxin RelB